MLRLKIISASEDDVEGIATVAEDVFPQDFQSYGEFDLILCQVMFFLAINDPNEFLFVAKIKQKVVGFAYYINKPPRNGTVILEMIGVLKNFQDQSIGTKLLSEADKQLVKHLNFFYPDFNLVTIHLTTSKDNPVGQRLYLKCGYKPVAEIPGFVGKGNIEIVMLKKVKE